MIIQILFTITAMVTVLVSIKMLGAILGNRIKTPYVNSVFIQYSSVTFQLWYWSQPLFS